MQSAIYILLPVHNRVEITTRFCECLLLQSYANYKLILIDDGSTDGTADVVKSIVSNTVTAATNSPSFFRRLIFIIKL